MTPNKMTFIEFCERLKEDGAFIGADWHLYRKNGKPLSRMCRNGYYMVRKMYDNQMYHFMEHRVIWYICKHKISDDMVINHKDFDRANNNITNLEMVSQSENVRHAVENGRFPDMSGTNSPKAALSEVEVQAIRYMAKNGWKQSEIAKLFNANNQNLISRVVTGMRYGKVQDASSIFAIYPTIVAKTSKREGWREDLSNIGLGITGEAGEVADVLKKHLYHGHDLDVTAIMLEMGDVLYYLCWLCLELGLDFSELCFANMKKLNDRYPEGFSAERSIHRESGDI